MPVEQVQRSRVRYDRVQTHLPNIILRVASSSNLNLDPDFLPVLLADVTNYHNLYQGSKEAEDAREKLRGKLVQTLWEIPQLRGIEEKDKKRVLDFIPEHEVDWNVAELRKSLGPLAGEVIKEHPHLELLIPTEGLRTARGAILTNLTIRTLFIQTLMQKGVTKEDAEKVIRLNRGTYVDEEALQRLEKDGKVQIPEGLRTEKIVNWRLTPYTLR